MSGGTGVAETYGMDSFGALLDDTGDLPVAEF